MESPKISRFISLRTKFVLFISLIIVAVCSSLSWYFIEQRRDLMTEFLMNTGRILAENLAYNSRNAIFLEDQITLGRLIGGVMEVDDVVYVVMTGPEGKLIAAQSKGALIEGKELARSSTIAIYPDRSVALALLKSVSRESVITPFTTASGAIKETIWAQGKEPTVRFRSEQTAPKWSMTLPYRSCAGVCRCPWRHPCLWSRILPVNHELRDRLSMVSCKSA